MKHKIIYSGLSLAVGLGLGACSSSDGDESITSSFSADNVSLDALPALSGLVSSQAALSLAVSGTPATMREIVEGESHDQAFFSGAIAKILEDGASVTDEIRGDMERGQTICGAFANMGEMIKRTEGGTLCYMQGVPKVSGGVTVTKGSDTITQDDYSDLFTQEAEDKMVNIKASQQEGEMQIFIKVKGRDSSPDAYAFEFYSCRGGGSEGSSVDSVEKYSVNFSNGQYSREEKYSGTYSYEGNENSYKGSMNVTAFLRLAADGQSFEFDPSQDRIISQEGNDEGSYTHDNKSWQMSNKRRVQLKIDANGLLTSLTKRSDNQSSGSDSSSSSEEIWSLAEFSGSATGISFSQLAMKMNSSHTWNGETFSMTDAGGAVEWQDTGYADTDSGSFYNAYQAKDMNAEEFFNTDPADLSVDFSSYDCSAEADIVVELDMQDAAMDAVNEKCDGGDGNLNFHDMCYSGDVNDAMNQMWQNQ